MTRPEPGIRLPTWKGERVDPDDPVALVDVLDEALDVLKDCLDVGGSPPTEPADPLHGVEAASLLRFVAEAGQRYLVPIARTDGAGWGDLGRAMGICADTALSRHEDDVAQREERLRAARRPEPPAGFTPSDDDVVRDADHAAWRWDGDLDLAIRYARSLPDRFLLAFRETDDAGSAGAWPEEEDLDEATWRLLIGSMLADRRAGPADARPGESLAELTARRDS